MEIEKLFVSLALNAAQYADGLKDAQREGASFSQRIRQTLGGGLVTAAKVGSAAIVGVGLTFGAVALNMSNEIKATTGNIQSELGVTAEEAGRLGDTAVDVFRNNFADSVTEAGQAVTLVRRDLQGLNQNEMQDATENAFRLRDAFGVEIAEGVSTADTLMEEFGLTQQEAFDLMAKGMQNGLNRNDDFLDSIGEYSNLFADAGFSADQFYSLMETGAAGGVLGTDKIADAFKEFQIRANEGAAGVSDAWDAMGFNFERARQLVADGTRTWSDYFPNIISGLQQIEDPIERNRIQTELFGTMAEDLGTSFADGLSTASTSLSDMEGAIDSVDVRYNDLGSVVEGFKRRAMLALTPIGDVLLDLANRVMPLVDQGFVFLEETVVPALETAAEVVQSFVGNLEEGMTPLDAFIEAIWDIAPPELLEALVNFRDNILPGVITSLENLWVSIEPVVETVQTAVSQFVSWQDIMIALGLILGGAFLAVIANIVIAIAPVIIAIGLVIGVVALLRNAWENNWGGIQEKTQAVIDFIVPFVQNAIEQIRLWWEENGDAILAKANEIWDSIVQTISAALDLIINGIVLPTLAALQAFWKAYGDDIVAAGKLAWNSIVMTIEDAIAIIQTIIAAFAAAFRGDWREFGRLAVKVFVDTWKMILSTAERSVMAVMVLISGMVLDAIAKLQEMKQSLTLKFREAWNNAKQAAKDAIDAILTSFAGLGVSLAAKASEIGRGIVDGIKSGISSGAGAIADAARSAAQAALDAAKGLLGISSPSKMARDLIGKPFTQGIAVGIENAVGAVDSAIGNVLNRAMLSPATAELAGAGVVNSSGGTSYRSETTINLPQGADPMRAIRASRHLDKLGRGAG